MKTALIILTALFLSAVTAFESQADKNEKALNILVFSKTAGFRHKSISSGIKMIYDLSASENWNIIATENDAIIDDNLLKNIDVVVFLNPTGDAINENSQAALERFFSMPKGFVGIHAAADCEYNWPFYGELIGAYFKTHPPAQKATIIFEGDLHPAMQPFEKMKSYTTFDEWYTFKANPRENVNVLATLDESSIKEFKNENFKMGDHPIIWWTEKNGVRSFYTGFGHTHEAFQDKLIIEHIKNAINWAGKRMD